MEAIPAQQHPEFSGTKDDLNRQAEPLVGPRPTAEIWP